MQITFYNLCKIYLTLVFLQIYMFGVSFGVKSTQSLASTSPCREATYLSTYYSEYSACYHSMLFCSSSGRLIYSCSMQRETFSFSHFGLPVMIFRTLTCIVSALYFKCMMYLGVCFAKPRKTTKSKQ